MFGLGRGLFAMGLGSVFILLSMVLIFSNEGRNDLSSLVEKSQSIVANEGAKRFDDFVFVEGDLFAMEEVSDQMFLCSGSYISLHRTVEQFVEGAFTGDDKERSIVKNKEGTISSDEFVTSFAKIENYWIDTKLVDLPRGEKVILTQTNVENISDDKIVDNYIYLGSGTLNNPNLGDMRISYVGLSSPQVDVIAFGGVEGQKIMPYEYEKGKYLYRVFLGDKEGAISILHGEYKAAKRGMRFLGFFLMWIGLWSLTSLVRVVVRFIPFVGRITRVLLGGITFVLAVVLTYIVVVLGALAHSWIALIVVGILLALFVFWLWNKRKKRGVKKEK